MEERKSLVSVIVPVYNVYPYLRDCVQSVQAQSYQNWELLLVDDGSTDGSGELCDELAAEDGRIRVFHKPNGGQSDARNVGLQQTQGKYFYLLDSDDLIRSTALAQFVEHCEADGADAALTPLEMFSTEQPEGRTENSHQIPELLNREETMRRMLLHQGIGHGAGGVFFRREAWGDLQFPVGILYEDYAVMYRAIARCAKVEVFPEPMYDYRIHTGSTMKSGIAEKNLVILDSGELAGWAALRRIDPRWCYRGVAEVSIYVGERFRGKGLGSQLLNALCADAEKAGYWTLQSTVLQDNTASRALHTKCGFRLVGRRERIARDCHGRWLDTYLMERRAKADEPEGIKKL